MTVHGLQPALLDESRDPQIARRGRLKMLLVLLVCAAPVVASYFTYYVLRPQGRASYGELIEPQRSLSTAVLPMTTLDGRSFDATQLKGQWLLIAVGGGDCDQLCERQLYLQRQLREALGKEKERVDRVWLIDDAAPVRTELMAGLRDATMLRLSPSALADWLPVTPGESLHAHFFVVDPLGNLMMRFPAPSDGRKIQRDLVRLLRASAGWDQPGR